MRMTIQAISGTGLHAPDDQPDRPRSQTTDHKQKRPQPLHC